MLDFALQKDLGALVAGADIVMSLAASNDSLYLSIGLRNGGGYVLRRVEMEGHAVAAEGSSASSSGDTVRASAKEMLFVFNTFSAAVALAD